MFFFLKICESFLQVSLDESAKDGSKSVLFCETDDKQRCEDLVLSFAIACFAQFAFILPSHPICTLRAGVNDQMSLNLLFPSDGRLCLRSSPNSAVFHLLGYCEQLETPSDFDEDEDDISEGEEGSEDDEEEEEEKEVEVKQPELKKDIKRKEAPTPAPETPVKKAKVEQAATPAPPPKKKETPVPKSQSQPSVAQPAKPAEKKAEPKKEAPAPKAEKEDPLGVQKKLGMGITYTVSQRGQGAKATPGKKVNVQYRGWLKKGGKEFDKGKIQFRLGLGEVIKGWDIGVEGLFPLLSCSQ